MAKKKTKKHRKPTIALATLAGFGPIIANGMAAFKAGGIPAVVEGGVADITGYSSGSKTWDGMRMMRGSGVIALGVLVHKAASWLGINRAIARAGIPLIRL